MNSRSLEMTDLPPRHRRGFALVVTLCLMVLLTVIAVGLLTMSASTTRASNSEQTQAAARANAKIGLMLALSELQKAAGPDQRITSQADILTKSQPKMLEPALAGRSRWVGVWDTSAYNPAMPDTTKTFVRWLVSSDETAATATATTLTTPSTRGSDPAAATDVKIFNSVDGSGNPDKTYPNTNPNSVMVPKVEIRPSASTDPKPKNYYAYWVEDEGVKADLGWKEGDTTNATNTAERQQAARLSAAPGVDYGVFEDGPFTSSNVKYPITKNPSTDNPWLTNIDKALSPADMPLLMSSGTSHSHSNWLKSFRHDITLGSRGVMADVKKGGLRRDLSLAFEMDGAAESGNATTNFNAQYGEFVGKGDTKNDTFSAPSKPAGLPVNERLLWRDKQDIIKPKAVMRGPNWWALRDYANLYKRLSGSSGDYTLPARAYYPNRSSEGSPISAYYDSNGTEAWDVETSLITNKYLYRPARANYAPVNLGTSILVSMLAKNVNGATALAVGLDPLFYFWNPYNRKIKCENLAVTLGVGFPGRVAFEVLTAEKKSYVPAKTYNEPLAKLLKNNVTSISGNKLIFLIKGPLFIEPGEVVIASPVAAPSGGVGTGEAVLGYATDNDSGIIMTKLNGSSPINVRLDDQVAFSFLHSRNGKVSEGEGGRHEMDTSLPKGTAITPASLAADTTFTSWGEQTQHLLIPIWQSRNKVIGDEYVTPGADSQSELRVRSETVSALVNTKVIYGAHSLLIKPASPAALGDTRKPYEMFARFNPAPSLMRWDYFNRCFPNQIYRHVTAANEFNVINDGGIDFSGAARNTFWGLSYLNTGSTSLPVSNIPSSPLFSLASFSDANLSIMGTDPFHAVGNSWSSPLIPPSSAYGLAKQVVSGDNVAQDFSWLINDALFDRYYLSGMAPAFTIGSGGYTASGTINATLTKFFSSDYKSAQANPVLRPYLPLGGNSSAAIAQIWPDEINSKDYEPPTPSNTPTKALTISDGYKKMGAYSLIDGAFNVNSTSIPAWTAFLRGNRNLAINYAQGTASNSDSGSPFPGSSSPSAPGSGGVDPKPQWSGFSRLTEAQIKALATRIVDQVKLRGPFMSLSDFINHKMGTIDPARSYTGALQAALDLESDGSPGGSGINAASRAAAGGTEPTGYDIADAFNGPTVRGTGTKVTTGIPGDITQANLLQSIAPRLSARSDTFRIRSYGEVRSSDGLTILSQATCETIVQRVPDYVDPTTDAANNEPWDEAAATGTTPTLNETNLKYGRRFRVVQTRWLTPNEL